MYSYARYLSSKRTVDDRALNRQVFECVRARLEGHTGAMSVLEVGAGLGTMIARLVDWGLLKDADYYAVDEDANLIRSGQDWLAEWGAASGRSVYLEADGVRIQGTGVDIRVHFVIAEIRQFLESPSPIERADLLIANAFLDLVELPATLRELFALLKADGVYWFSINYDSETVLLPEHSEDTKFFEVYDRSMDQRVRNGRCAGDSMTGRHLFQHLRQLGASILAAGASDWVVHAGALGYPADEAYFLSHILLTIEEELKRHAEISRPELEAWIRARRGELDRGELVYIAHQLDFAGHPPR